MKKLIVILLLILGSVFMFIGGVNYSLPYAEQDIQTSIKFMERARYSHQYYIDNPEQLYAILEITPIIGDLQHHIECVIRYNFVINTLKGCSD